jgi:hypothetical protein
MGRTARHRLPAAGRTLTTSLVVAGALAVAAVSVGALALSAPASGNTPKSESSGTSRGTKTTTTTHPAALRLARSGKVGFWECSAKTTEMLVAVNTLTLHPGATLDVSFTVKNVGSASCNYTAPYAGVEPGPTSTSLQAGQCGSIGFEIENGAHHNVWPGTQVVNCPALGFARLAPGATVSGTGTWDQTKPNSTARVSAGHYTLVVGNRDFSFPLRVLKS